MKTIATSSLVLLASHLVQVLSAPTTAFEEPTPTRAARNVGDTTTVSLSATETWTLTITLQEGSGNDYDDDDVEAVGQAFAQAVGRADASAVSVNGMYNDTLGNGYDIDLDLDDGVTIGSKTNAYWAVAGNTFASWTLYQQYPTILTARANDNSDNNKELGFYEFTYTPK